MPKLRISGAMWYLLWFLGMNEINKCRGVLKWKYMVENLWKRKIDSSKRLSEKWKKKNLKKIWSWTKAKRKKWRKKKSRSAIWALLCKVSGIDDIWKEKLCSTSL